MATRSRAIWMTSIIGESEGRLFRRATHGETACPASNHGAGYGVGSFVQAGIFQNVVGSLAACQLPVRRASEGGGDQRGRPGFLIAKDDRWAQTVEARAPE